MGLPFANEQLLRLYYISLLWGYWGYLGAAFANEQRIGFHCSGATGAALGLPFTTSKSLDFVAYIALGLLGYLEATFANKQIIRFLCHLLLWGYLAVLWLLLRMGKSLDFIALALLGLPWSTFANEQIIGFHCIALLWGYWGYLGANFSNEQVILFPKLGLG